jgi:hypothetical protein
MKVHELYSDSSCWNQGNYAKTVSGQGVLPDAPEATCWCLMGALYKCYPDTKYRLTVMTKIYDHLHKLKLPRSLVLFNDDPETTYETVKALALKLDI